MPNTNTTLNTASTTYLNKTYYDRNLLENAKTVLCHAKYGQMRNIPKNNGKRVEFRRWTLFDPALVVPGLTEGVTPAGQELKQTNVEAEVKQYGAYVEVSDLLKTTAYDDVMEGATDMLGEQMGVAIEWITRDVMASGSNVQFAGNKLARDEIEATDKLTTTEIRRAVRTLKKRKAKMFKGNGGGKSRKPHYICICSPDAVYDLQDDPIWQDASKYSDVEQIYSGEIGRLFGVVFIESTEAKAYLGEGAADSTDDDAPAADVHAALIFGRDAYGIIDIEGSGAIRTIIKGLGSGGTADPLDQRCTVGAKVDAYTAQLLNQDWIVRIEHGVSA
jgi:N4-gp56 family major capsid protein